MVLREVKAHVKTADLEAEISELEKQRERLVNELFQMASKVDCSRRAMVESVAHNPEIGRIDARIKSLQAQQSALRASTPTRG